MACGIVTHVIMSHGILIPDETNNGVQNICLPDNCLVVKNCMSEVQLCRQIQQSQLYDMYSNTLFDIMKHTQSPINIQQYLNYLINGLNSAGYQNLCLFSRKCPNLKLTPEMSKWRDGIFELPIIRSLDVHLECNKHASIGKCTRTYREYLSPCDHDHEGYMRKVRNDFGDGKQLSDIVKSLPSNNPNHLHLIVVHACTVPAHDDMNSEYVYHDYSAIPFNMNNMPALMCRIHTAIDNLNSMDIDGGAPPHQVAKRTDKKIWAYGRVCTVYRIGKREYVKHKGQFVTIHQARTRVRTRASS